MKRVKQLHDDDSISSLATRLMPCTVCGGAAPSRALPFAYRYAGAAFPAVACTTCGLARLAVRPADLTALYRAEYFDSDYRCGHATRGACEGGGEAEGAAAMLALIEQTARRGRLLEVGPAGGEFLRAARTRGWQVTGVELSPAAAEAARAHFGLDVRDGDVGSARFAPGSFDVGYMGDVLEHVPDPCGDLREVWRILKADGEVVIAGPTTIHSMARRLGLAVYGWLGRVRSLEAPPYHLWEFTPKTLCRVVEAAGFRVVSQHADKIPPPPAGRCGRAVDREWLRPLEWLNVAVTRLTGRWGDRLVLVARKVERPPR